MPLRTCRLSKNKAVVQIHEYTPDPQSQQQRTANLRHDLLALALSLVKLTEFFALWQLGALHLSISTSANWAFFWLAAVVLQLLGVSREDTGESQDLIIDVLGGKLPTVQSPGEDRRLLLGVPLNVRKTILWTMTWVVGGAICAVTLITTYISLGGVAKECFYVWIAFQCLWLFLRSVYYHVAVSMDTNRFLVRAVPEKRMRDNSLEMRISSLTMALARYQILSHPRGEYSYTQDNIDPLAISTFLEQTRYVLESNLELRPSSADPTVSLEVLTAIGDTVLSSIAWVQGLALSCMDLYDSCLLVLRLEGTVHAIPCVRVLSGPPKTAAPKDEEDGTEPAFPLKGTVNWGVKGSIRLTWVFWAPAGPGKWLHWSPGMNILGEQTAVIMDEDEVQKDLDSGSLWIGIRKVDELRSALEHSTTASEALCRHLEPT